MTSENQALLDAIRGIVSEAVAPLTERMDRVETELHEQRLLLQGVDERLSHVEEYLSTMDERLTNVELRLLNIESRLDGLEAYALRLQENLELLDGRTSQIARDQFETQQQLDRGFRTLKRETMQAMSDLAKVQNSQRTDQNRIRELEEQVLTLQQRLEKLEARYGVE